VPLKFSLLSKNFSTRGGAVRLRHCVTSRKDAGSISDDVIGICNFYNPSGRTVATGSTQPVTETNSRNIYWMVKAAGA